MVQEKIYGVFEYNGKEYPFALDNQILTIPQIPFQYNQDFNDLSRIEAIQGVTNDNRDIIFIGCEVLGNSRVPFATDIKFTVLGYIWLVGNTGAFDRIDFYSPAINGFYFPRNAYEVGDGNNRLNNPGIKVKERSAYQRAFDCQIDGEKMQIGLDVYFRFNLNLTEEKLGTASSLFSISFPEKKRPTDVLKYYLYLRDFLAFVNFRNDIPLERIELFEMDAGKYHNRGRAVIFQPDSSGYTPDLVRSITFIDITADCFPKLFERIAEKRLTENYNPFFYPENRKEDRIVDASKWLNTAIGFEGEFDMLFRNYRAENDQDFHDAKALLLQTIANAVQQSGKGINNKQNAALKTFKSLIEHADTTIKQKFQLCQSEFRAETEDAIANICRGYQLPEDTDLADAYALYRNQTAHGVIQRPEKVDVATYRILRCFVYTMNLKKANVPTERIREIVGRLF